MKFKLILIILCFISLNTYAQGETIKGKVIDKESLDVLIGANVIILNTELGAATDVNGYYEIRNIPPGTYNIKVSFVGYSPVTFDGARVTNAGPLILDFELEEDFNLPSIKIVNKKFYQNVEPSWGPPWIVDMFPIKGYYFINKIDSLKQNPPVVEPVVVEHPRIEN